MFNKHRLNKWIRKMYGISLLKNSNTGEKIQKIVEETYIRKSTEALNRLLSHPSAELPRSLTADKLMTIFTAYPPLLAAWADKEKVVARLKESPKWLAFYKELLNSETNDTTKLAFIGKLAMQEQDPDTFQHIMGIKKAISEIRKYLVEDEKKNNGLIGKFRSRFRKEGTPPSIKEQRISALKAACGQIIVNFDQTTDQYYRTAAEIMLLKNQLKTLMLTYREVSKNPKDNFLTTLADLSDKQAELQKKIDDLEDKKQLTISSFFKAASKSLDNSLKHQDNDLKSSKTHFFSRYKKPEANYLILIRNLKSAFENSPFEVSKNKLASSKYFFRT